jgi:N-methylhydantoinase B
MSYRVTEGRRLHGAMFGMRETLPIGGGACGDPGAPTEFVIRHPDGSSRVLEAHASGVALGEGEVFELRAGSGGGWGDPLDRLPERTRRDVTIGRLTAAEADAIYGVVLAEAEDGRPIVDGPGTMARREAIRAARLQLATPPARRPPVDGVDEAAAPEPLYHGVVQRGRCAVAEASGAVLAIAPDHWTSGCPVLEARRTSARGIEWEQRSYLDPRSGRALYVEAVPVGATRSFSSSPRRWTDAT